MDLSDQDLEELKRLLNTDYTKKEPEQPKPEQKREAAAPAQRKPAAMPERAVVQKPEKAEKAEEPEQSGDSAEDPQQQRYESYTMLRDLAVVLIAVTLIFTFFLRLVIVDGSSMFSTLVNGDTMILESNFLYRNVKAGDVVVLDVDAFDYPIVKRIIATEGQEVFIDFEAGQVFVDGLALDEPYIFEPTHRSNQEYGLGLEYPLTVPQGCIFVMGDNRNHSSDSRDARIGCVGTEDVIGKVLLILLPGRQTNELGDVVGGRSLDRIGGLPKAG